MNFEELIEAMSPDIYESLKSAVELGKWPNGVKLTQEQREQSLRAVIAYEHQRNMSEEQRVGYIDRSRKDGSKHGSDPLQPDILKILNG